MKFRYLFIAVVTLVSGLLYPREPEQVLFIGEPCVCLECIGGDCCQVGDELIELLAAQEYQWVVVLEPAENRQWLAGYLLRTQPQAEIVLMADEKLAASYRVNYAPDCCAVLEMMKKDGK